jgi:BirA family biotin operon repressor/biotin-[acetyl-CoA-carboxylase] ligase
MRFDRRAVFAAVNIEFRDVVSSTNDEALKLARRGERGPLWVVAKSQTAGRGRRGRTWISEPGNLYASLLLTNASSPDHAPELSFVAGLALHDSVKKAALALRGRLRLKWPNDLLVDGAKIAGVLIEAEQGPGCPLFAVIGFGVNCASHPSDTSYPATNLYAVGTPLTPEVLFPVLSEAMLARLAQWRRGERFLETRADWLSCSTGLGLPIRVSLPERDLEGVFETLDGQGRLLLRLADGSMEKVAAGDVFSLRSTRGEHAIEPQ